MKIAIVGGGTGGHIYPALALAEELQEKDLDSEILFIGSPEGIENELVSKERFTFETIKSRGMPRKLSLRAISAPFVSIAGFFQARRVLRSFSPRILISTGGYVSLPVAFAAKTLGIPVLIHELNTIPGLSNRISGLFAKKITLSFPEAMRYFPKRKVLLTGTPVRKKIINAINEVSKSRLELDLKRKTILILGGSQGARKINEVIIELLPDLLKENCQIIHITGKNDFEHVISSTKNIAQETTDTSKVAEGKRKKEIIKIYKLYRPIPYMYNIWDALASADLVISRAGGSTLAEILARGLPSILIPFPYSSEGHQDKNARSIEGAGAAIVLKNDELSRDSLLCIIRELLADKERLMTIAGAAKGLSSPEASKTIIDSIYEILDLPKVKSAGRKKKRALKQ